MACSIPTLLQHPPSKGAKRLGMRLGNWLTADQGRRRLLAIPRQQSVRDNRDYAILSLLLGCGLRRA
jgi:hypothetical protein